MPKTGSALERLEDTESDAEALCGEKIERAQGGA